MLTGEIKSQIDRVWATIWATVSGSDYWEFDSETPTALRLSLEDEQQ